MARGRPTKDVAKMKKQLNVENKLADSVTSIQEEEELFDPYPNEEQHDCTEYFNNRTFGNVFSDDFDDDDDF